MAQTNVLFREIHKNAWLKRLPNCEKKVGSHPKKGERVWTVFCVHNDKDPLLELYNDQKEAGAHKPDAVVQLSTMLHVSPTLCATEDEFEFVVTLPSEVVRFTAPTWDQMMEWVDSIGCKLREMRILSPKENVYSRMPEQRPLLLPTRDPNSPLPLPPAGPSSFVPGVQPVLASDSTVNAEPTAASSNSLSADRTEVSNGLPETASSRTNSAHYARASQRLCSPSSVSSQISSPVSGRRASSRPPVSLPSPSSHSPSLSPSSTLIPTTSSVNSNSSNISNVSTSSDSNRHNSSNSINSNNVTVIEVSSSNSQQSNSSVFDFSFVGESLSISNENEEFFTPPGTPVVPRSVARFICNSKPNVMKQNQAANSQASSIVTVSYSGPTNNTPTNSVSSPNLVSIDSVVTNPPIPICSLVGSSSPTPTPSISVQPSSAQLESTVVTEDELTDNNVYEHLFLSMNQSSPLMSNHHTAELSEDLATPIIANPLIQNIHGPVSRGRGNPRSRRRGSHPEVSSPVAADRIRVVPSHRLQPAPRPLRPPTGSDSKLTLREQQVIQLRREIMHPGGVRLQLRRKDCLGPIALVDAFGAVWVAGWKQKEHPMLYNVLHIGDQIVSVTGVQIHSAADALKVIRGVQSLYIEFVIRRVPCGRIYAIRREREGQSLGIVQESGTAEIREIVPLSLAAMQGLTSRTPTMDGLSLTSWVLTEINGRPLNLFFKDNEVRDRLNAVGLDISILVQPFDLIKQIKKQLKTLRSYKDFIVQ